MSDKKKVFRIYKADKSLQLKVGAGPLDEKTIAYCEEIIRRNKVDFTEIGEKYLDSLETGIQRCTLDGADRKAREDLIAAVMELKANAAIFHYPLITQLSDVMLTFLEKRPVLDNDAIALLGVYQRTLQMIMNGKMRGDGGAPGAAMVKELSQAIERYHRKHGI